MAGLPRLGLRTVGQIGAGQGTDKTSCSKHFLVVLFHREEQNAYARIGGSAGIGSDSQDIVCAHLA